MSHRLLLFAALLICACRPRESFKARDSVGVVAVGDSLAGPPPADTGLWTIFPNGAGPARSGVALAQLNAILRDSLRMKRGDPEACQMLHSASMPKGVSIMVLRDTIQRVDIDSASVFTPGGLTVGDSEAAVLRVYTDHATMKPHKYLTAGHYISIRPQTDTAYGIVFETDGVKVTHIRAGAHPAVDLVEKCL
jgi:hypothetical protein